MNRFIFIFRRRRRTSLQRIQWSIVIFTMVFDLVVALNICWLIYFFSVIFVTVMSVCAYRREIHILSEDVQRWYSKNLRDTCNINSLRRHQYKTVKNRHMAPDFTCLKQASIRLPGNVFLYTWKENIRYHITEHSKFIMMNISIVNEMTTWICKGIKRSTTNDNLSFHLPQVFYRCDALIAFFIRVESTCSYSGT